MAGKVPLVLFVFGFLSLINASAQEASNLPGDNQVITFFLRQELQEQKKPKDEPKLPKAISSPERFPYYFLKKHLGVFPVPHVIASYAGFVTQSDNKGEITLPRKSNQESLLFVVTPIIQPIILRGQTVHAMTIPENVEAKFYSFERFKDDQGKFKWRVSAVDAPPQRRVPPLAVTLFANPKHIIIKEGIYPADPGPNLVLPWVFYTKKRLSKELNALLFLRTAHFFAPVLYAYEKKPESYAQIIMA